jgi:hypothetical protein
MSKTPAAQLDREIADAVAARSQKRQGHHRHADLIFRNASDTRRIRVFRRESGRWDYDVFTKGRGVETYSSDAGDDFATRAAAKWHALENTDATIEIDPVTVTEGW